MFKSKSLFVSFIIATLLVGCGSKPKFNAEYCDGLHQPKKSILDSANANDAEAQMTMVEIYTHGHCGDKDAQIMDDWLHKSAENNNTDAQGMLGASYLTTARGGKPDVDKAVFWLSKAVEKNDATAMVFMGDVYYYEGFGRQDKQKAREWYEKSAKLGHPKAKERLAQFK